MANNERKIFLIVHLLSPVASVPFEVTLATFPELEKSTDHWDSRGKMLRDRVNSSVQTERTEYNPVPLRGQGYNFCMQDRGYEDEFMYAT